MVSPHRVGYCLLVYTKSISVCTHICYAVYMYNLRAFRSKTKEAFDKALAGEEVLIDRDGSVFLLSLADMQAIRPFNDLLTTSSAVKLPVTQAIPLKEELIVVKIAELDPTFTPCRHFANPPHCKFAKFDKTRKQKWCK